MKEKFINKVFNEDVLEVLRSLPDECVDVVYGDPDYNVGIKYAGKNYTTKWEEYINWYIELTKESLRILKKDGNLFMINYPKQNAYLRVKFLDEHAYDVFDYVWVYNTNVGHSPKKFTTAHRSILHATKSKDNKFYKENVAEPYLNPTDKRIVKNIENGSKGRMPYSWLYYNLVKNVSKDKTFHACQIPLQLFEKLILASTKENDTVFVLFGGSGSEIVDCVRMKRNYISCEIHPKYFEMIKDRLDKGGIIDEKYKLNLIKANNKSEYVPLLFEM
ncbi:MAG TPA: site-specific DNA-methyltransferase [Melioribacteraceae bacterium]|nr:site-specific DNA-methyltransferase [Melioribacteraceae bacterium]